MIVAFYDLDMVGSYYDDYIEELVPNSIGNQDPLEVRKVEFIPAKKSVMEINNESYKIHSAKTANCTIESGNLVFYVCFVAKIYIPSDYISNHTLENKLNALLRKEKIQSLLD